MVMQQKQRSLVPSSSSSSSSFSGRRSVSPILLQRLTYHLWLPWIATIITTTTLITTTTRSTVHNNVVVVQAWKIAFVGDTGMWGEESYGGYGQRTFDMIQSQNVDLVVDVGDFDYWGRCIEEFAFVVTTGNDDDVLGAAVSAAAGGGGGSGINNDTFAAAVEQERAPHLQTAMPEPEPLSVSSQDGILYTIVPNAYTTLKRYKWQYGRHGALEGWEIGIVIQEQQQQSSSTVYKNDTASSSSNVFNKNNIDPIQTTTPTSTTTATTQRLVISDATWMQLRQQINMTLVPGERNCYDEPWDGPWEWIQFLKDYDMDFLGASGNVEVREGPTYGSPEIWASHQTYLYQWYMERIVQTNRGMCRGYDDPTFPGSVREYGERFSCFYGNGDHHILFLGWFQGSTEHWRDEAKLDRQKTMDFIDREFSSTSDPRVQNARWRYCVHHMTSAKLSAGEAGREHMELSGITDACRRHGALIFSGHHHIYSRTKMLTNVGGPLGNESIAVAANASQSILQEGVTMSITVGMGGYDGSCTGNYANASWMETCVASFDQHRGAVIAEFDDKEPWMGTFRYLNSLADGAVVDEFQLTSRLPGWDRSFPPSASPSLDPTEPAAAPSFEPGVTTGSPVVAPSSESSGGTPSLHVPEGVVGPKPEEQTDATPSSSAFQQRVRHCQSIAALLIMVLPLKTMLFFSS